MKSFSLSRVNGLSPYTGILPLGVVARRLFEESHDEIGVQPASPHP